MTQERIQAVTEFRFALDTVRASLRGVAEEQGRCESLSVHDLATTVQRHRALACDVVETLDYLDASLEEMKLGFEHEPPRVRIDVQDLAERQAVLVSGGRLLPHSVEALERFMDGEGKLVVLEAEASFDTGQPDGPDDRATIVRDGEGRLRRLNIASGLSYLRVTVAKAETVKARDRFPAWPNGTSLLVQGNVATVAFLRSKMEAGMTPGQVATLTGVMVTLPDGTHPEPEWSTTDGRPPGGDRSTYPDDNRLPPEPVGDFFRVTQDGREQVLCAEHYASFAREPGGYGMTPTSDGPCAVCPTTLDDVRAVEMPSHKTVVDAAEAKLAQIRKFAFDESPAAMVVLAIRDVLGAE